MSVTPIIRSFNRRVPYEWHNIVVAWKISMRTFEREQFLAISIEQAWDFISNPRNLAKITPASLDFQIVSDVPELMHEGMTIEYRVKPLLGIAVPWISVIKDIRRPYTFTDEQMRGPYKSWKHVHVLREAPGGVLMEDRISYAPPFDAICPWINAAIVLPQLNKIFDYRSETLTQLFGS